MVINIWVHKQIKCIIGVSLCHCILPDVFEIHQTILCTTEFFLSIWNWQIQWVSWFETKRNTFLDFTPAKGVEKSCSIIIYTYVQSFKWKTGRLKGFKGTFHDSETSIFWWFFIHPFYFQFCVSILIPRFAWCLSNCRCKASMIHKIKLYIM